jgi:hypothetical protein
VAPLIVQVNHRLPQDEALRRVKNRITELKLQYSNKLSHCSENWTGYVLTFAAAGMGHQGHGSVWVNPSNVTIQGQLDLAFPASLAEPLIGSRVQNDLIRILS